MAKSSRAKLVNKKKAVPPQSKKSKMVSWREVGTARPAETFPKKSKPAKPLKMKALKPTSVKNVTARPIPRAQAGKRGAVQLKVPPAAKPPIRKSVPVSSQKHILIKQYEAAVKLVYSQEFEKAKAALEKIIQTPTLEKDVVERARSLLIICQQKLSPGHSSLKTSEDYYNMAVALMNQAHYKEAREQLHKALKSSPKSDFILYGLAATNCQLGHLHEALEQLQAAIELKQENRYLARNDPDFEALMTDPRFVALVFPERKASKESEL